jgi:WASH complex subunit 7
VFVNPTKVVTFGTDAIPIRYPSFLLILALQTGVRNLSWYVRMKPLRLPFVYVDVKFLVEMYLNFAFYGHSVMPNYDHKVLYKLFLS